MPRRPAPAGTVSAGAAAVGDRLPVAVGAGALEEMAWCWIMVLLTANLKDGGVVGAGLVSAMRVLRM